MEKKSNQRSWKGEQTKRKYRRLVGSDHIWQYNTSYVVSFVLILLLTLFDMFVSTTKFRAWKQGYPLLQMLLPAGQLHAMPYKKDRLPCIHMQLQIYRKLFSCVAALNSQLKFLWELVRRWGSSIFKFLIWNLVISKFSVMNSFF